MPPSHDGFECMDCSMDTWDEYYMVFDSTWKKAVPEEDGMLCIKCLETRLGHKLTPAHFTYVLINQLDFPWKKTQLLQDRLSGK